MCVTHVTHYWQINWNCANCPPKNLHNSHIKYWLIVSLGCWNRWSFSYSYGQLAWLANDKSRIDGHHILHAYCFCCWAAERINYAKPMNSSPNRKCREIQIRNESDNEMHFSVWWLLLLGGVASQACRKEPLDTRRKTDGKTLISCSTNSSNFMPQRPRRNVWNY